MINDILYLLVIIVGIITVSKYIVLWIVKGIIKFKFIKNLENKIIVKEYVLYKK
jgi:hypothetical protein